jgi:glycosyltransferase involved in cell wall biosynthesis
MVHDSTIAVIIPALNEQDNIARVLQRIPDFVDHIIVVDDGSTDKTAAIAKEHGAIVRSHHLNRGVGAAFQTGRALALKLKADVTVNIDADGQFNPEDIASLIEPIVDGEAEFVTASRFSDRDFFPVMGKVKFYGNKFMSYMISTMTGQKFYDVSCGFRAYSRDALLKLNLFGDFTYTQETFLNFAFKKVQIREIPVRVRGKREIGKSRVASNVLKYGYQTLKIIIKTLRDYRPFRLFAGVGLVFFALAFVSGVFLMFHYFRVGEFTPHKWAGFVSGFFALLAVLSLMVGFILDIFARMRINQEEMLYYLKKNDT